MDWLLLQDQSLSQVSVYSVLLGMLLAFVCGQALAWTYMFTHSGLSYSRTYVNSLVIIPFLVAT
ncbi:MAG: hypothetical protein LR015_01345 [Verrucomicrobia bacterium]|nr:hypothetical protein [Verrucomicrobiota bacterium]